MLVILLDTKLNFKSYIFMITRKKRKFGRSMVAT